MKYRTPIQPYHIFSFIPYIYIYNSGIFLILAQRTHIFISFFFFSSVLCTWPFASLSLVLSLFLFMDVYQFITHTHTNTYTHINECGCNSLFLTYTSDCDAYSSCFSVAMYREKFCNGIFIMRLAYLRLST